MKKNSGLRNFSLAFVKGIVGSALKKDNVSKHGKSDMHSKAINLEQKPSMTLSQIYCTAPIGKAMLSETQ